MGRVAVSVGICLLVAAQSLWSDSVEKQKGESIEQFVQRTLGDSLELAHPLLETKVWGKKAKAWVVLSSRVEKADQEDSSGVMGHVYMIANDSEVRDIEFGPIFGENESEKPEILSVFFVNADRDAKKEMVVLSRYRITHYDANGYLYQTNIFDAPDRDSDGLGSFDELGSMFHGCEYSSQEGSVCEEGDRTAEDIKRKLRKMGFR